MQYHAAVTLNDSKGKYSDTAYEIDVTREFLVEKIAAAYLKGSRFFVGGHVCEPRQVTALKFMQTNQSFQELVPFIRAERARSNLITAVPDAAYLSDKAKDITREILDEAEASVSTETIPSRSGGTSNKIFVVYGHDTQALDQTEILLLRWGLEPVILRDRASEGRTVIEKIEANSDVGFGIVLLTPDDLGCVAQKNPDQELKPRARQNVILEWGYLMAKVGRRRVACLVKEQVEMPSDLHGIVRINIGADVKSSAPEIARELRAAGFKLKELA